MNVGICNRCNKKKELCKSHIVPKSFYVSMRDDPNDLIQVSTRYPGTKVKRKIGVYDTDLLCLPCESELSEIDAYGKEVLLNKVASVIDGDEISGCQYQMDEVRIVKLKQFFVSVLWRAVVSNRPEFETVKIDINIKKRLRRLCSRDWCRNTMNFHF